MIRGDYLEESALISLYTSLFLLELSLYKIRKAPPTEVSGAIIYNL